MRIILRNIQSANTKPANTVADLSLVCITLTSREAIQNKMPLPFCDNKGKADIKMAEQFSTACVFEDSTARLYSYFNAAIVA